MQGAFWGYTIWYLLLAVVTIVLAVYLFAIIDRRKFTAGFGFAVLGSTFFSETVVMTLLNGYQYKPKISRDPFLDSIIGNYFSQFSLTVTALLVATLKPPKIVYFMIAAAYGFIETGFLRLGIYEHLWYKTVYTLVLVLILLWVSKSWYEHLLRSRGKFIYAATWFLGASAAFSATVVFFLYAFSIQVFHVVIFPDNHYRNQAFPIVAYRSVVILLMMILHRSNWKWLWKGAVLVGLAFVNYALVRMGAQTFKDGYFGFATAANFLGAYAWVFIIDRCLKAAREG